jgi:hypothetical protein
MALLLVALVGPLLYVVGALVRGTALLEADYGRLTLTYLALALSAAAAVLVALRSPGLWRWLAVAAVVGNLASILLVTRAWSRDRQQALAKAAMAPVESGKVGVLLAKQGYSESDNVDAQGLEKTLLTALQRVDLAGVVSTRVVSPVSSEEQAGRLGRQLNARLVLWTELNAQGVPTYHVTVLGADETPTDLEPLTLMLLMASQDTFSVPRTFAENGKEVPVLTRAVVPVTAGFVALAVDQPVLASAQFQAVAQLEGLPSAALFAAHAYRGIALLRAQRPDLAEREYLDALKVASQGRAWVGLGNVRLARREWRSAADAYQQALALDLYDPQAYCGLGATCAVEHNVSKAVSAYGQAIALDPASPVPYALLGRAYELIADIPAAKQAYDTCAALSASLGGLHLAVASRAVSVVQNPPTPVPTATPFPTATPAPTPVLPKYTVQKGDTLASIADELGVTVEQLVKVNNLENQNFISIGQELLIPEKD